MATVSKSDASGLPQYPGSGQPQVPQPGQFVPTRARAPRQQVPAPAVAAEYVVPRRPVIPVSASGYVDPILYETGFFRDQADYDQTVRLAATKIKSGQIPPREPDLDEGESS